MKLSSTDKFSQNLKWSEDGSNSTHIICYIPTFYKVSISQTGVGLLFYPLQRQCEKPVSRVKHI
ncbi:hypothetical protein F3C88_26485 [Bacteroides ovatus]|nr:hypothetical protein F3C88_26485 [Bacteroides ovatus]